MPSDAVVVYLIGGPADMTKMAFEELPSNIKLPVTEVGGESVAVYVPVKETRHGVIYEYVEGMK
jgi:hypothetical protein